MITVRNLNEFECFLAVSECRSFSEASIKLKMSKNSVSRFITNLEDRLGEKVFRRSTREVHLTAFGEKLLQQSEKFWESLLELESALSSSILEPQGTLRIIASNALSGKFLYRKLDEFHKKYRNISTEIDFSDGGADTWKLDEHNIDILFGFPHVPHITDEWKHKHIGSVKNLIVASPSLLNKLGEISKTSDLMKLPFITHNSRNPRNLIPLSKGKGVLTADPIVAANSFTHMKELCKTGMGAALLGENMVEEELRNGQLKKVLPNLPYLEFSLHAFCRASEYSSTKIRAFMDFF